MIPHNKAELPASNIKRPIMTIIESSEQFDSALQDHPLLLAYFSGPNCNVCASLKPKIEMLVEQQFPTVKIVEVKTELCPDLSGRYTIFSIPAILFFVEGRDYLREVRNISTSELAAKMDKIVSIYEE